MFDDHLCAYKSMLSRLGRLHPSRPSHLASLFGRTMTGGGGVSSGTLITFKGPVRDKLRTTFLHVAGPKRQVISEELHDQSRILVALFGERVEFGNRIVKRLLGEVACTVGRVEDLVVEYRKVERETEADGVGGWEFSDCNVRRGLVGLE